MTQNSFREWIADERGLYRYEARMHGIQISRLTNGQRCLLLTDAHRRTMIDLPPGPAKHLARLLRQTARAANVQG